MSSDEGRARTERETAGRYVDADVGDRDRCAFILPICRSRSARGASSASMASHLLAFSLPPSFSCSLSLVATLALNELRSWTMQFRITKRKLFLSEKCRFPKRNPHFQNQNSQFKKPLHHTYQLRVPHPVPRIASALVRRVFVVARRRLHRSTQRERAHRTRCATPRPAASFLLRRASALHLRGLLEDCARFVERIQAKNLRENYEQKEFQRIQRRLRWNQRGIRAESA